MRCTALGSCSCSRAASERRPSRRRRHRRRASILGGCVVALAVARRRGGSRCLSLLHPVHTLGATHTQLAASTASRQARSSNARFGEGLAPGRRSHGGSLRTSRPPAARLALPAGVLAVGCEQLSPGLPSTACSCAAQVDTACWQTVLAPLTRAARLVLPAPMPPAVTAPPGRPPASARWPKPWRE